MTKLQNAEGKVDPATEDAALDVDHDGMIDIDPAKAQLTMTELVLLDHELRDHSLSLGLLLRAYAKSSAGIVL